MSLLGGEENVTLRILPTCNDKIHVMRDLPSKYARQRNIICDAKFALAPTRVWLALLDLTYAL